MADAKISELPVLATPESIDKLLIVDTSESTTKHITYGNLVSALQGANVTLAALGGPLARAVVLAIKASIVALEALPFNTCEIGCIVDRLRASCTYF